MRSFRLQLTTALTALALSVSAGAWEASSAFRATIHDHVFHHMAVQTHGCSIETTVRFEAPEQAYRSQFPVRNHYRFKARVRFDSGKRVISPIFYSNAPAKRRYVFRYDTSAEGCWAKTRQRLVDINVEGCRGKDCRVAAFGN